MSKSSAESFRRKRRRMSRKNFVMKNIMAEEGFPDAPAGFVSDDAALEGALRMFAWRTKLQEAHRVDESERPRIALHEERWRRWWHESLARSTEACALADLKRKHDLNDEEIEAITALVIDRLGLLEHQNIRQCGQLLGFLGARQLGPLNMYRMLGEEGRLYREQLIMYDDCDEEFSERVLIINPQVMERLLFPQDNEERQTPWQVSTEKDLHRQLCALTMTLKKRCEIMDNIVFAGTSKLPLLDYRVRSLNRRLYCTLDQHPEWKMSTLFNREMHLCGEERLVVVALLSRELGHLPADDLLFTGRGLVQGVSSSPGEVAANMRFVHPDSALITQDLIRPYVGNESILSGDEEDYSTIEYELTDKARDLLGIQRRMIKDRAGQFQVRPPRVTMQQLVLNERIHKCLSMAMAQARNASVLFETWGFGETLSYGRGVTLLFSGPPGTGKTACAEAIAHELQAPILVVDYSQILNCFVGNTEKALVRIFRDARAHNAVLFWDEADAMFYNRARTERTFEVQFANVLLTELERFDGVCILGTNRKVALDPALERRITLKIEFERPTYEERLRIWRRLMPEKMPVEGEANLAVLAEADLCGGEIKNVILNAARLALARSHSGPVTRTDFDEAIRFEKEGRLKGKDKPAMGFH